MTEAERSRVDSLGGVHGCLTNCGGGRIYTWAWPQWFKNLIIISPLFLLLSLLLNKDKKTNIRILFLPHQLSTHPVVSSTTVLYFYLSFVWTCQSCCKSFSFTSESNLTLTLGLLFLYPTRLRKRYSRTAFRATPPNPLDYFGFWAHFTGVWLRPFDFCFKFWFFIVFGFVKGLRCFRFTSIWTRICVIKCVNQCY